MGSLVTSIRSTRRRAIVVAAGTAVTMSLLAWGSAPDVSAGVADRPAQQAADDQSELLLFAADGLVQDRVEAYAEERDIVPGFRDLIRHGAVATDGGLLTQAPPNTGAGWNTLSTGAWPGVAGSTNNTFHINGQPFGNRTAAFDPGVLQAETLAQAAERGGLKVAQIEWAGGRIGAIDGPTLDFRTFLSGRGVATNYIAPTDDAGVHRGVRSAVRPPGRLRRARAVPRRRAGDGDRVDERPAVEQPGVRDAHARARLRRRQVRPQRLHLRQHRRRRHQLRPRAAVDHARAASDSVGDLEQGEWADVKVTVQGGALAGKTAAFLTKIERLTPDLSQVRLFHTSVTRAIATLAGLARRARLHRRSRTTSPPSSRPPRPATSPSSRPASSARRPTSSRACTGSRATTR